VREEGEWSRISRRATHAMSSHAPVHHPWDMAISPPCPPRLRWSPGVCEWSSRALRSILAHAATAPLSARAGKASKSVSGETDVKAHEKSTTTTCRRRRSECDSAARLLMSIMCVEAGRITYLLQYPFSISHPTIARHGRQPSPCTPLSVCDSACLSLRLACLLPFSCVPRLPSQLCVQCCPAARARTPVWLLPAELGVVAGSARKPAERLAQAW
jgi:hypothetical protein